jgi:uncharacterized protein (DUF433 family)
MNQQHTFPLPDFLAADDGGFIHIAGHRIGLHHMVRLYNDGYSPEMMALEYPTLPLALVHKVIAFYLENTAAIDAYVAEQDAWIAEMAKQNPANPSLAELRRRFEAVQRSQVGKPTPFAKA